MFAERARAQVEPKSRTAQLTHPSILQYDPVSFGFRELYRSELYILCAERKSLVFTANLLSPRKAFRPDVPLARRDGTTEGGSCSSSV